MHNFFLFFLVANQQTTFLCGQHFNLILIFIFQIKMKGQLNCFVFVAFDFCLTLLFMIIFLNIHQSAEYCIFLSLTR